METLYDKLSNMDFPEQSWLQLICCTICLLHSHNFRRWIEVQRELSTDNSVLPLNPGY